MQLDHDARYRFTLTRRWGAAGGEPLVWCMLNPSTADESVDDPTIRRCIGFSQRAGHGSLIVVNLCPWRATQPKALFEAQAAGLDVMALQRNASAIRWATAQGPAVAAWGSHYQVWMQDARRLLPQGLQCLGLTKTGHPRHPLMVGYAQHLRVEAFKCT